MDRFTLFSAKVDDIHIVDERVREGTPDRKTLCDISTVSHNYMESDRHQNIDKARGESRRVCLACLSKCLALTNNSLDWWEENYGSLEEAEQEKEKAMKKANPAMIVHISADKDKLENVVNDMVKLEARVEPLLTPEQIEEEILTHESKFADGETLEDLPRCAIEGCGSRDVKYWIHHNGTLKYFCGDCEDSDIEKPYKFAESVGTEVGSYDPPLWAVKMRYVHPDEDTRIWLIKAHNMAQAIQMAEDGEYEVEIDSGPGLSQGAFRPIAIRKAFEEEESSLE